MKSFCFPAEHGRVARLSDHLGAIIWLITSRAQSSWVTWASLVAAANGRRLLHMPVAPMSSRPAVGHVRFPCYSALSI